MEIDIEEFKQKYLYFEKTHIGQSLQNVIPPFSTIYPQLLQNEVSMFDKYITNSQIKYSNCFTLQLKTEYFEDYIDTLPDSKIEVDIVRLSFTKKFVKQSHNHLKKIANATEINISNCNFMKNNNLSFYNIQQIQNKDNFVKNILTNFPPIMKYLLHQDIHNSIINPILSAILISKCKSVGQIIFQLCGIKQVYLSFTSPRKIKMMYIIKKFFILNMENDYSPPIEYKISPFLIIHIEFIINNDNVDVQIIF